MNKMNGEWGGKKHKNWIQAEDERNEGIHTHTQRETNDGNAIRVIRGSIQFKNSILSMPNDHNRINNIFFSNFFLSRGGPIRCVIARSVLCHSVQSPRAAVLGSPSLLCGWLAVLPTERHFSVQRLNIDLVKGICIIPINYYYTKLYDCYVCRLIARICVCVWVPARLRLLGVCVCVCSVFAEWNRAADNCFLFRFHLVCALIKYFSGILRVDEMGRMLRS